MEDVFEIKDYLKFAEKNKIDLSKMYSPYNLEEYKNWGMQDSIMRLTRNMCSLWDLNRMDTKEILYLFKEVKDKLGNHPYHHILEGRIASVVQRAYKEKISISPEFIDDYLYFEFMPWNDPHLYYNTLENLKRKKPEAVPPEFRN